MLAVDIETTGVDPTHSVVTGEWRPGEYEAEVKSNKQIAKIWEWEAEVEDLKGKLEKEAEVQANKQTAKKWELEYESEVKANKQTAKIWELEAELEDLKGKLKFMGDMYVPID